MPVLFIVVLVAFIVLFLAALFYFLNTFQQRIDALQNQLRINLDGNAQLLGQRLDNAAKVFGDLQNRLGKLSEANEKIYAIGKDLSSLHDILKRPKARGALGEFFLADILSELLPQDRYEIQHRFKSNEQVDAVVKIGERILSVDSKFPLENFRRLIEASPDQKETCKKQFVVDVKRHIDSIARKYIQPAEGTFDFAFMYIHSENVFYEIILRDEGLGEGESLQEYAQKKRVIPVSPNSFYAYLGALLYALRGERLQKNVHEILSQMRSLVVDMERFADDFRKIGVHLNNLRGSYDDADKRLNRYQDRLGKIQGMESGLEERPEIKLVR